MVTQELLDYIKEAAQSGQTVQSIKVSLLNNKWKESDIDRALSYIHIPGKTGHSLYSHEASTRHLNHLIPPPDPKYHTAPQDQSKHVVYKNPSPHNSISFDEIKVILVPILFFLFLALMGYLFFFANK